MIGAGFSFGGNAPVENKYVVTTDNEVRGPHGTIYEEGDRALAERLAAFLNSGEYAKALEISLDSNDHPISGAKWLEIIQKTSIRGEEG
jgi:hypothetical protein